MNNQKTPRSGLAKDRVVRVFVSSTFRDMIEDRNELMSQVWPALRRHCRERVVEFVDLDLRWGITEEQAQRNETLRHCLAEIKRCRPYFIGLLGERYGWMPGAEAFPQALLDEECWLEREVAKRSVTELEILHGVLNDPNLAGHAFFYFRNPKYAKSRGSDYGAESATDADRQAALKQQVKTVCEANHIPLREDYANPQALAALVLADLTSAIDAEYPADEVPDVWTSEGRSHEAYGQSRRTEYYVGRDVYYEQLDVFARDGAGDRALTVLGESGGGKSALLANWVARWSRAHPDDFVFQHYIGSSPMSAGHLGLMRRLMVAIVRWCDEENTEGGFRVEEETVPARAEEIVRRFPEYLDRLGYQAKRKGVRAVIVLDALNQLEDRERGSLLVWLPRRLPSALRLVVSTLPGDTLNALQPRSWPSLTVEPLAAEERVQLIARYLLHFSQGLSDVRARKISAAPAAANPLYLKTLLDDLRATGAHDRLDQQIADYLQAVDIPALLVKILARYERDYERDCPGLVREALSLLWAARRGLTEPELLEILKPVGPEHLPVALWSPVRFALEDGLVDRDGVMSFAHDHLRLAVERRYVPDADSAKKMRHRLAEAFAGRPLDARQADELPWLLRQAEARDSLRACLLDIARFLLIQERDQEELLAYWVWLNEERVMGRSYLESFGVWSQAPGRQDRDISYAANELARFLDHASLHAEAEPLYRQALAIAEQRDGASHPNVAVRLNNLAQLMKATNRLDEAEPLMRRALAIDDRSLGAGHPNVARDLSNLAGLLQTTNRLAEAEPLIRRALAIDEEHYGANHPNVARDLNNLAQLLQTTNRLAEAELLLRRALAILEQNLGEDLAKAINNLANLLHATNRPGEAEPLLRRALAIDEQNLGDSHPDVAIRLNNLAALLQTTNRLAEAEPLIRRALAINTQSYGANHPNVATVLNHLAQLLQATNRLEEAERLMRLGLVIDEQSLGANHPKVAGDLNNLAVLLKDTNRLGEAEQLLRRALTINEQSYGANHPKFATNLHNLATVLQASNRLGEAEALMRRASAIRETSLGNNHPDVAISLSGLAGLLNATNRSGEAEPLMRRVLAIDELSYGANHPNVARDLNILAQLLQATNRLAEAEPSMRRALAINERVFGANHPKVATDLNNLAVLLQASNRLTEAESLMRRVLAILSQNFGENHPNVAAALNNLAELLRATNRLREAEPLMRRTVGIFLDFTRHTGHPHPHLDDIFNNYGNLLLQMGLSQQKVFAKLNELGREYGFRFGA
jgi:nephrocystin-3